MGLKDDERNSDRILYTYGVNPYMHYFDSSEYPYLDRFSDVISGISIAYGERNAYRKLGGYIYDAITGAMIGTDRLYAGRLRRELERCGIYGVSIWDSRDTNWRQMARTVAKGRLRKSYERRGTNVR